MNLYNSPTYLSDLKTAIDHTIHIKNLKNTSILITGSTGTIGSFIIDMLMYYNKTNHANIRLYIAGRNIEALKARFNPLSSDLITYVSYDMNQSIAFDYSVDYIIHSSGNAHPAAFTKDPVGTILSNINSTYSLLNYAKSHKAKRLLYVSSGEVYGQGNLTLNAFTEDYSGYVDPLSPRSCYPNSKRTTETLCTSYSYQYGLETVIVRPCHTYGPNITSNDNRAHVQFIKSALKGEPIILKSLGQQLRSYCYIGDCASALLTVLINGENSKAYNIANPNSIVTIAEFAKEVAKLANKDVIFDIEDTTTMNTPIIKQVLDSTLLEQLGWKGYYNINQGITNTIKILNNTL